MAHSAELPLLLEAIDKVLRAILCGIAEFLVVFDVADCWIIPQVHSIKRLSETLFESSADSAGADNSVLGTLKVSISLYTACAAGACMIVEELPVITEPVWLAGHPHLHSRTA